MKLYITTILISINFSLLAQIHEDSWLIQASHGIEHHDKRLFKYSEKEALLILQPEKFGTYSADSLFHISLQTGTNLIYMQVLDHDI